MAASVVSVLFTDLVGSTELSARLGAIDADRVRFGHLSSLREVVDRCGGREVKNVGDGIMAVFPSVGSSLDAAIAMQQAVHRDNNVAAAAVGAPVDGATLMMRVGVAVGDCTEEDGDYFGEPVVQAARLCALAAGAQILATDVVRLLAPRGGHELSPVGDLELKGLPDPVAAVEVLWHPLEDGPATVVPLQDRLLLPDATALVGRAAEAALLRASLDAVRTEGARVVLVSGEAGLGKTRLSVEMAREAFDEGALVLYGRCDQEVVTPYRPWVELLDHYVAHASDADLALVDQRQLAELGRLVPRVHDRVSVDADVATPGSGDQYVLFGAVAALLGSMAQERVVLLVVEDLHWADRGTAQLLRHVATALPRSHLLLIGTFRDNEVGPDHPVAEMAAALHREATIERVALSGLSEPAVGSLVDQLLAGAPAPGESGAEGSSEGGPGERRALAGALRDETGGNPFFVGELARHLLDTGAVERSTSGELVVRADLSEVDLPQSVREVVAARVRRLGPRVDEVLSAASVLGRDFELSILAGVTDLGADELVDLIQPAVTARLVVEDDDLGDRLAFAHALVHHSLYRGLTGGQRARLHRRAAEVIERRSPGRSAGRAGEVAHHLFLGLRREELARAVPHAVEAGECAMAASAPGEAVRWFDRALGVIEAEPNPDPVGRARLLLQLGDAERDAGVPRFREDLLRAAELARGAGEVDLQIAAAIANNRSLAVSETGSVDLERVALLESALEAAGPQDRPERALLLAGLAGELIFSREERRFELAGEAVEVARRSGDDAALVVAIHRAATVLDLPPCFVQRHRWVEEALAITEVLGDPVGRFLTLTVAVRDQLTLGDMGAAERMVDEAEQIARRLGRPTMLWHSTFLRSTIVLGGGGLEEAERLAGTALQLANESGQRDGALIYGAQLMQVRWHQGRTGELIGLLARARDDHPDMPVYTAALAYATAVDGDIDHAATLLEQLTTQRFPFPKDWNWGIGCALAAQAASRLGDTEAAALLSSMLAPHADLIIATGAACLPAISHYLGVLAVTLGRPEEAERHLTEALTRHERLGAPFHCALTRLELADLVARRDARRAEQLLDEVLRVSEELGFEGLRTEASARRDALI